MTKDRFTGPARSPFDISSAMKWKNTSGESIPAYACVKLDSYDVAGGFFNAIKPDGTGDLHFVNGPVAVAVNKYGGSQLWNQSRIGLTSSTTFGATVGPVSGSWEMTEDGSGFVIFSEPSGGEAAILQVGGGGGGSHRIFFEVTGYECISATEVELTVNALWYTGGCTATIPGEDSYGITVKDPCGKALFFAAVDLTGKTGFATYMYPRSGTCTPRWLLDDLCGVPECA